MWHFSQTSDPKVPYTIALRGYNKFFNIGEVESWTSLGTHLHPPFEITVKENGCIIFISSLNGRSVIVTSKHSVESAHAKKGREWLRTHLERKGKTEEELAKLLKECRLTAVCELADDSFEEHILPYTGESRGLYVHGLNLNTRELRTLRHEAVDKFAEEFGFHKVGVIVKDSLEGMSLYFAVDQDQGLDVSF